MERKREKVSFFGLSTPKVNLAGFQIITYEVKDSIMNISLPLPMLIFSFMVSTKNKLLKRSSKSRQRSKRVFCTSAPPSEPRMLLQLLLSTQPAMSRLSFVSMTLFLKSSLALMLIVLVPLIMEHKYIRLPALSRPSSPNVT